MKICCSRCRRGAPNSDNGMWVFSQTGHNVFVFCSEPCEQGAV